ncbi:rifin PIR protein, putative [Plasmodium reichenowi]|uniref:Rifin PIR protein, putative n=1 Tax=Plasmodium reichenowi TaxID=5854 RepID=A0A2P9DCH5_PLARE|nr:rifin PIR protein, putative [Plasmodium reichenowi]
MKVHYINILLFALPLNILVYNQRNHYITAYTHTNRSLCECELHSPANYDNDPQMKRVMQQFEDRTTQRFHEYDDRIIEKRKQCKEKCDKEIQKIILKDKLEKQMEQKLTTLETKIDTDDTPTCVCEKSIADKVEKGCLRCAQNLGGIVAPSSGVLGGIGEAAISVLKPTAITSATNEAIAEATALATEAGMEAVRHEINVLSAYFTKENGVFNLTPIVKETTYNNVDALFETAEELFSETCKVKGTTSTSSFCNSTIYDINQIVLKDWVKAGITKYNATFSSQKELLETAKVGAVKATYAGYHTSIIASIVAIVVIVLIMVIIYLILRYRRKKKMKKKLQYIKLLEE